MAPRYPVKVTRKGTKAFTEEELIAAGYSPEQAKRIAEMDSDNELPKKAAAKRGRPRKQ